VEWHILPDPATAAAALQAGEEYWLDQPLPELIPTLQRNRNIEVGVLNPSGIMSIMRLNHLQVPFNDRATRQAVALAVDQHEDMRATLGEDRSLFPCGTPFGVEDLSPVNAAPRSLDRARRAAGRRLPRQEGGHHQPDRLPADRPARPVHDAHRLAAQHHGPPDGQHALSVERPAGLIPAGQAAEARGDGASSSRSGAYSWLPNRSRSPGDPDGRSRRMANLIAFAGSNTPKSVMRSGVTRSRRHTTSGVTTLPSRTRSKCARSRKMMSKVT
jgi:hypothetical protein